MEQLIKTLKLTNTTSEILCHHISDGNFLTLTNVFTLINSLVCVVPSGWDLCNLCQNCKALFQIIDSLISMFSTYNLCQFPF